MSSYLGESVGLKGAGVRGKAEGELHRGGSFEFRALNVNRLGKVIFSLRFVVF